MVSEVLSVLLQLVIIIIITVLGIVVKKYLIPWIKTQLDKNNIQITQEQWDMAVSIITTLVQSASRLQIAGKLSNAKDYVLTLAKSELEAVGIQLSDEAIDNIRRAAVIEWEKALKEAENGIVIDATISKDGDDSSADGDLNTEDAVG